MRSTSTMFQDTGIPDSFSGRSPYLFLTFLPIWHAWQQECLLSRIERSFVDFSTPTICAFLPAEDTVTSVSSWPTRSILQSQPMCSFLPRTQDRRLYLWWGWRQSCCDAHISHIPQCGSDAFEDLYLNALSHEIVGYTNCTSLQLPSHILMYNTMIAPTELTQNCERLNTPYDPTDRELIAIKSRWSGLCSGRWTTLLRCNACKCCFYSCV
jgi:hypothetical protein